MYSRSLHLSVHIIKEKEHDHFTSQSNCLPDQLIRARKAGLVSACEDCPTSPMLWTQNVKDKNYSTECLRNVSPVTFRNNRTVYSWYLIPGTYYYFVTISYYKLNLFK